MLVANTPSGGHWRAGLVLVPGLAISVVALIGFSPLPQDPLYHAFADQRALYGMPHFWNVVSNVPFALIGLLGCWWILRAGPASAAFEDPRERLGYLVFFAGEFLTCFGSGYYHSGPSNQTLVWDRLVFSLMLTSMFSIVVSEFVDRRVGRLMLAPIVLLGVTSVLYWSYTEMHGHGDVRLYAVVQFYPVVVMPVIFLVCRSRYTHARLFAVMWGLYAVAKAAEVYDGQIYAWSALVSGHTIKHFVAAGASCVPLYALTRRLPVPQVTPRADRRARPRVALRRWGLMVTIFYAVVVIVLLIPGVTVLMGGSWSEAYGLFYGDSDRWVWIMFAGFLTTGQALLFVRVGPSARKRRRRAHVAVTAAAVGFATALLFFTTMLAAFAGIYGDDWPSDLDELVFANVGAIWVGLWMLWAVVFYHFYRRSRGRLATVIAWLLTGSILELLVAVPAHIVARRRDECCAQGITAIGIATGTAIMLMCFGPSVVALYQRRRVRYRTRRLRPTSDSPVDRSERISVT